MMEFFTGADVDSLTSPIDSPRDREVHEEDSYDSSSPRQLSSKYGYLSLSWMKSRTEQENHSPMRKSTPGLQIDYQV